MSGVTILEQQHVFVTLLDFRDGALLHGVIPNLNIFVYVLILGLTSHLLRTVLET